MGIIHYFTVRKIPAKLGNDEKLREGSREKIWTQCLWGERLDEALCGDKVRHVFRHIGCYFRKCVRF
jgi:hypothetical protein